MVAAVARSATVATTTTMVKMASTTRTAVARGKRDARRMGTTGLAAVALLPRAAAAGTAEERCLLPLLLLLFLLLLLPLPLRLNSSSNRHLLPLRR